MTISKKSLDALESDWKTSGVPEGITRLPVQDVAILPGFYQARPGGASATGVVDPDHAADLTASLKESPRLELDAILVLRAGNRDIVIDGHHRLAAYKAAKREDIPVTWFRGSPRDALIEAGLENAKTRLPMSSLDRLQRAWQLTTAEVGLSIAKIARGSGVSSRTVSNMREKLKAFQVAGANVPQRWLDVLRMKWDDPDEAVQSASAQAREWTNLISTHIGPAKTFKNPGKVCILGDALVGWSRRNAELLAMYLAEELELIPKIAALADVIESERQEEAAAILADDDGVAVDF